MIVKTLYAISKTTGFLAKALEKSDKKTDDILEKEYIFNAFEFIKEKAGDVVKNAGYAIGKVEEKIAKP